MTLFSGTVSGSVLIQFWQFTNEFRSNSVLTLSINSTYFMAKLQEVIKISDVVSCPVFL